MKTLWSKNVGLFGRIASGTAALIFCCLPVLGQSSPPMMVQVPFVSAAAGGAASNCAGAVLNNTYNNGDGCPAAQVTIPSGDAYSTATDQWGNVYFSEIGSAGGVGIVRVIYAGAVTVNGVVNPATAMIENANSPYPSTTVPIAGDVYTVAGGLTSTQTFGSGATCANGVVALSSGGAGCPGTDSYIKKAYGLAVDAEGNVFLLDGSNSVAYVVLANASGLGASLVTLEKPSAVPAVGSIYIVAGAGGGYIDGVLASAGKIHGPYGIAVDASENLYIADYSDNAVRMVNGPNTTTTDASSADCLATNGAPANGTCGPGFIHSIAGACTAGGTSACTAESTTPTSNTAALGAAFVDPAGIAVDAYGNVYVGDNADSIANVPASVRMIYSGRTNNPAANLINIEDGVGSPTAGDVYTIAGGSTIYSSTTGATGNGSKATDSTVTFDRPYGLAVDSHGNIFIADYDGTNNMAVAEVNASTGILSFLAGGSVATLASGDTCSGGTTGPTMTDAYGDGCPATQGIIHHAEGNLSFDSAGNIYVADNSDGLVRKLSFSSFPAITVGSAAPTQSLAFSVLTGNSSEAVSSVAASFVTQGTANSEFVNAGTGDTCTGSTLTGFPSNAGTQGNSTCVIPLTFTPAYAGVRSGAVEVSGIVGTGSTAQMLATAYLSGTGKGAALVIDPGAAASVGSGSTPEGVATDSVGNVYVALNNGNEIYSTPGGPVASTPGAGVVGAPPLGGAGAGEVVVAATGNNRIAEYVGGAATPITAVGGLNGPEGVAVDGTGNLYIADTGNSRVLEQPISNGVLTVLVSSSTFSMISPTSIAVDATGNVYFADSGAGAIVKIPAGGGTPVTVASGIQPMGLAVDAAGDIVYSDLGLKEVEEIPLSGSTSVLASGLTTPVGVALDPGGNIYVADTASTTGVSFYSRAASTQNFASISATLYATLTNIGNQGYSQLFTQSDSTDFTVSGSASNGCTFTSPLVLASGANCGLTALFTPSGTGNLTDTIAFNGSPTLTLTGSNAVPVVGTTTTLGSLTPASPTYGNTMTVTVTVSPDSGSTAPTGTISFVVDGGAPTAGYPLAASGSSSMYTYTLPALSAGNHTVVATYTPTGNSFSSSASSQFSITVAQLAISATVTTTTPLTALYGQAIPTINGTLAGVLSGDTANVTPVFTSTASAGSPVSGSPYSVGVSLTGSAAPNYTVTLNGTPTVVIQPATVNVTVNSTSKVYGAANPTFTGTPSGVYGSDPVTVNYSTTATQYSAVNGATGYPVTVTGLTLTGSAVGNYTLGTVTNGKLTITQLGITASVTSPTDVTYGSVVPALSGTLTGVVNNDNVTVALTTAAVQGDAVGSYPITLAATALTGTAAGDYTVTLSGSPVVAIQPLAITATPNPETVAYGVAIPAPTGTLNGVLSADASNVNVGFTTTAVMGDAVGNYPITLAAPALTGSAAGNYNVTLGGTASVTITQATTTTALTELAGSVGIGSNASFTATVTSVGGTPTGSVVFSDGSTTPLCTLTLSGGTATCSTSLLSAGSQNITASYQGSTDFASSTSNSVTENVTQPVVTGVPSGSSTITIAGGSSGTITLNITAIGGYTGTATYSCAFLPANMTCSFAPPTSTFTATNTTATTVLTISTKAGSTTTAMRAPQANPGQGRRISPVLAAGIMLPGALIGLLGFGKRRKQWQRRMMLLVLLAAGMAGMATMSGCGGSSSTHQTAAGTYNIQVEITAGTVQTVPLTVVVQ